MSMVRFEDRSLTWQEDESLLDCLQRSGLDIPSSCRSGVCQSCIVRTVEGTPPPGSQEGLKDTWKQQGLILSCACKERTPLTLARADAGLSVSALCTFKELRGDVVRFRLRTASPFDFRAGQFISLNRDGLVRSYSIASIPSEGEIELHVRKVANGKMSAWLHDELQVGASLTVRGPAGECFYTPGKPEQPLLFVGTGTGLAPLWGIVRDALAQGHTGPILVMHGARMPKELYFDDELRALAIAHPNLRYLGCLSDTGATTWGEHHRRGRTTTVLQQEAPKLAGWRVFICGNPAMVKDLKQHVYRAGVEQHDIFADAFVSAPPPAPPPEKKQRTLRTSLKILQDKPGDKKRPLTQKLRFTVQALILAGFLLQGVLYYNADFRPLGNLLPFMAYDSLGHMMVSSALIAWAALFALVMIFGRFVCGWLCPIGFIQDSGEKLLRLFKVKLPRPRSQPRIVRFALAGMVVGHFAIMPLLAAPVRLWQVDLHFREPWLLGFPFRAELFALDLLLIFVVLGIVLPLFFGPRPYCKMVCETGYLLDRASSVAFGRIRRNHGFDQDTCLSCGQCTAVCPQGINVHEEVNLFDRVVDTSCIGCLQCVNTCPNDTIIYSLRKRVADTGKVAGYLATLHRKPGELPRHVLTGIGVIAGAYTGFRVLPPSYFHTYLLLASLGGLTGFLVWRATKQLFGKPEETLTTVEREARERLLPLSPQEKLAAANTAPKRRPWGAIAAMLAAYVLVVAAAAVIVHTLSPRIAAVSEIPSDKMDAVAREKAHLFYFAIPPTLSEHDTHRAYGTMHEWMSRRMGLDASVLTAESYGELALALEHRVVDAAIVPAGTAAAILGRQAKLREGSIEPIAQVEIEGRTTYSGALVATLSGPSTLQALRGMRLAITSFDSVSGCLAPMALLRERGIGAMDLGEVVFAGTHQKALALLADGRVDAAATFDGAIERFNSRRPGTTLVTLEKYEGLLTDTVLVRTGLSEQTKRALRETLLSLATDTNEDAMRVRNDLKIGSVSAFVDWDAERFSTFKTLFGSTGE